VEWHENGTFGQDVDVMSELESFHQFLGTQLANGGAALTPEECLDLWRAEHPPDDELQAGIQAVQEALADMEAGDVGQPLEEFLRDFRAQRHLPS
jgi:hypothetical protein